MTIRRIVLVHGAAHGAWCWERVAPLLRADGFDVVAFDLPGAGADETPPEACTMAAYVVRTAEALGDGEPAMLVGHSMSGQVISQTAEDFRERVAKLVYVAAAFPVDGEALTSIGERDLPRSSARATRLSGDQRYVEIDPTLVREVFYNTCSAEIADWAAARVRPQPLAPLAAPARLSAQRFGGIPKSYVVCGRDEAIPAFFQEELCARTPNVRVRRMDTDHSPFLSDPEALATILADEARSA